MKATDFAYDQEIFVESDAPWLYPGDEQVCDAKRKDTVRDLTLTFHVSQFTPDA